jgi:hypothetical protein
VQVVVLAVVPDKLRHGGVLGQHAVDDHDRGVAIGRQQLPQRLPERTYRSQVGRRPPGVAVLGVQRLELRRRRQRVGR